MRRMGQSNPTVALDFACRNSLCSNGIAESKQAHVCALERAKSETQETEKERGESCGPIMMSLSHIFEAPDPDRACTGDRDEEVR